MNPVCRLIAFYLPQYHPIPENDAWWGEGFTEWQNVRKAQPLFEGHYQPHVPADLGYYDLRDQDIRVAQAELARQYGIEGFCYYHYWFQGKRLLERPVEDMLDSGEPDFPFCICWANENWTRRWDGEDQHILMQQQYSEDDDREHIRALIPLFEDKRYIRVDGKPLFLVYRTENLPDPARTANIWREEARKAGIGDIYLCRVESVGRCDPVSIGFDASVEFAPDWKSTGPRLTNASSLPGEADSNMARVCEDHFVYSYASMADNMIAKPQPEYPWFRCVTPSWDNTARRKSGAHIFVDAQPETYQAWLREAIESSVQSAVAGEKLVFINAWNEWAEGNHLEPDQRHGHAYLKATRAALNDCGQSRTGGNQTQPDSKQLEDRLRVLEKRLIGRDREIAELHASTSWRLTRPLRWLKRCVKALNKDDS